MARKLSKSDQNLTREEEEALRERAEAYRARRSMHFQPGSGVVCANVTYAVVCVQGERMLVVDGEGNSGWIWPIALRNAPAPV